MSDAPAYWWSMTGYGADGSWWVYGETNDRAGRETPGGAT